MRKALFSLFLVLTTCQHPVLAADAGSCYTITDADARAYCLAKAHKQSAQCYAIQSSSLRAQCLAEVRK